MTETEDRALPYRTRFVVGSCWPALAGFVMAFAYMFIQMHASGYFESPMSEIYEGGPNGWVMIMFPIMIGLLVGVPVLVLNAILFLVVQPRSARTAFLVGIPAVPVGVLVGIGIKCLL